MPMTSLPKAATGTSRAVVRLAMGAAQAVCMAFPYITDGKTSPSLLVGMVSNILMTDEEATMQI
eukprot:12928052-Prorocentrum_lima.AAC.1